MNSILKITLNVVGTLCVLLGIAGIFLPLLPTTPFLLVASACYLRGSQKLYAWLHGNKHLGRYLKLFGNKEGIPLKAKFYTVALLWGSLLLSVYRTERFALQCLLGTIGCVITTFILRLRTLSEIDS